MTPGREYGIGKYGRNTYDKWRQGEYWIPIPSEDNISARPEIWTPITEPTGPWVPING